MKKLKMIDLFAGAGGLTLGFHQNKIDILDTIEIDENAIKTYNFNFEQDAIAKDITNDETRADFIKKNKNKAEILIGGFPCQGFSMAGRRNPDDPRNKLYLYTIEIIKKTNPEVVILENVKGLLSMEKGQRIKIILEDLNKIGYYAKIALVNSANFGVPQKRERIIFIASKMINKNKVNQVIKEISNFKINCFVSVKDAIEDLISIPESEKNNHQFTKHSNIMKLRLNNLKEGESLYDNYKDAWKRIYWNQPSPTVKENHGATHVHPKLNRVLTARELARLQSFPDDFIFKGSKSSQLRQIGNAVPVKLSNEIAKIILDVFFNDDNINNFS